MHIKPADIIALGAFLVSGLVYLKAKAKAVVWVLASVGGLFTIVSVFSHSTGKGDSPQSINQSANISGQNSTVNQAGHDVIINNGVSEATIRALMTQKWTQIQRELAARYPNGYVILGIANGKLVSDGRGLVDVRLLADWDHAYIHIDKDANQVVIDIPDLIYSDKVAMDITAAFPFSENTPESAVVIPNMYFEVLDASQGIFLIGFK